MPVEQDDEVTTFDPKPWGARQRLLPNARFTARTSGPLQASSVAAIVPLPQPGPLSVLATYEVTMTPAAPVPVVAPTATVLAELPLTAYGAEIDSTMRVRRAPLTARSLIAVPLGAALAAIVIMVAMSRSSAPMAAASVRMTPSRVVEVPVLAPSSAELAATAIAGTQAGTETEIEIEIHTPPAPVVTPAVQASATKRTSTKRAHSSRRPRKIVAVDASTPLGNLRPRRF